MNTQTEEPCLSRCFLVCGLNGAGKSSFGQRLARETGLDFLDIEDLYFPDRKTGESYPPARSRKDVEKALETRLRKPGDFILASVKADYGRFSDSIHGVILLNVPQNIRLARIRQRSFDKFGQRMLPGGDLHDSEEAFFSMCAGRKNCFVEDWIATLSCPVLRLDGTLPPEKNLPAALLFLSRLS